MPRLVARAVCDRHGLAGDPARYNAVAGSASPDDRNRARFSVSLARVVRLPGSKARLPRLEASARVLVLLVGLGAAPQGPA